MKKKNDRPAPPGSLKETIAPGMQVCTLSRAGLEEVFITATPVNNEAPTNVFERVAEFVRTQGVRIVSQDVFGIPNGTGEGIEALAGAFGEAAWPITWVEDGNVAHLSGTQVWAVSGVDVEPIRADGMIVGALFEDADTRFCRLGDIRPLHVSGTREEQARESFIRMETVLEKAGMDFSNVLRTWLYNEDILAWYKEFNKVRTTFFTKRGVFKGLVPASTGIGGRNPAGAALVAAALAMKPKNEGVTAYSVPSPLQCHAADYGSSFSRAVEFAAPDHRRLFISGTAGIGPDGETMYVDDINGQVKLTMEVVGAILESRDMSWSDLTRGIAYVKRARDASVYTRYCAERGLLSLPVILTKNDICRGELLFEIEVDAVRC
jgi:enamine deaminase RidA (YjgF/YER057c/UK114 family)